MFNLLRNFVFGFTRNPATHLPEDGNKPPPQPVSVNLPLPEDLVILILSHVAPDDLFNSCVYVEEWQELIHSQSLWSIKCQREKKGLPKIRPNPLPDHFYRDLYFARLGENLLKNPCGKDRFNHWGRVADNPVDYYNRNDLTGWLVENPPEGADLIPNTECQSCFSTTHFLCRKGQVIDLWDEGFTPELIETLMPQVCIGEWYCSRFDCGSEYFLEARLLDTEKAVVDNYHFHHKENQWTGSAWSHVEHKFTECPKNLRFVHFIHAGRDTQFWAGNYGSKMAEGSVVLQIQ